MQLQQNIIETKSLNFSFHTNQPIIKNLSLSVPEKSIYGFLGPNGAGKTTAINLITGLLNNSEDNIFLFGESIKKCMPTVFKKVGTLIETPSLYLHLSAINNLKIICTLRQIEYKLIEPVLELVGLSHTKNKKAKEFSLGMKQRLGIAFALISEPDLLILDEPVNGLDPTGMAEVRELIKTINKEKGTTIFLSSHLLGEIEKMCTHIGIIHKGSLKFQGTLAEIKTLNSENQKAVIRIHEAEKYKDEILNNFSNSEMKNNEFLIPYSNVDELQLISKKILDKNIPIIGLQSGKTLEDWFIQLTSK